MRNSKLKNTTRRDFLLQCATAVSSAVALGGCHGMGRTAHVTAHSTKLLFTSQGRTGMIRSDGSGLHYFDFKVPDQVTWQPGPVLSGGRRMIFLSMEARRDGPGRPFDQYYHHTPTHIWLYDFETDDLTEICTRNRLSVFYTPALVLSDERLLVQVVRDSGGQIFSMNYDGSDEREFTRLGEGLPYGLSLHPDGQRVAYHLASPEGYQIWTSDTDGVNRLQVAAHPDYLYFGPTWSPDGSWLVFQACRFKDDPGHDWSDVCLARADGSEFRMLTKGQSMWFGATYGSPESRGGGSNLAGWTRDGKILFPRRLPDSKVPWEYQSQRPDVDHFNRDFRPDLARGGTEICRLDPATGAAESLTQSHPPVWDFRASESPDGKRIVFCRAGTGGVPALFSSDADGSSPLLLTGGWEELGVDHPRWLM
jgi:Tol biopolymer transport system component